VTHPFHPLSGRVFVFIALQHNWGEYRVRFFDEDGVPRSLPASWTDAVPVDAFVAIAAGRSVHHIDQLLELVALVAGSAGGERSDV
jgi:hypothetical protein